MQIPFDFALEPSIAVHVNRASGRRFTAPQDVLAQGLGVVEAAFSPISITETPHEESKATHQACQQDQPGR